MQTIAGPHQIGGPNCFNCTTCHDSARQSVGKSSRKDLCLQCHTSSSPTMAYHSSVHNLMGVACTDCHRPHANSNVPQIVGISRVDVAERSDSPCRSTNRRHASNAIRKCLRCSLLPITRLRGKVFLSIAMILMGRLDNNRRRETSTCCAKVPRREAGPVRLSTSAGHRRLQRLPSAHGTVANNLLRQPATFLCGMPRWPPAGYQSGGTLAWCGPNSWASCGPAQHRS